MSADPPSSSGLPGRSRPQLSDLSRETTEDDLWNLDDDAPVVRPRQPTPAPAAPTPPEEPAAPSATPEAPAPRGLRSPVKPPAPRPTPADEIGELEAADEATDEVVTLTSPIDEEPESPAPAVKKAAAPEAIAPPVEEAEPEQPVATTPKETRPRSAATDPKGSLPRPRLNRREVIGIASFAVVVMIAALWVLTRFFSQLSFTSDSAGKPDFPLKGELAWVAAADTFWREPVRSGASRDVARREVVMIPVLELTLDPEHSGGGALRVIFRNSEGEPVGDPRTCPFGAGRFEGSGSATIAVAATDGFVEDGDFQAYRTGKGKRWTADVLEGPPGDTPASAFKKLSSIPILPLRR